MNEMNPNLPPTLDAVLAEFYKGPRPDFAFAVRLEAQLRQHQTRNAAYQAEILFLFFKLKKVPHANSSSASSSGVSCRDPGIA